MGFFRACLDILLTFPLNPSWNPYNAQQPIPQSSVVVHPEKASHKFVCHYPKYERLGWKSCNGPNSRDCWLQDKFAKQPLFSQYDINTNYEKYYPEGIRREYWIEIEDKAISPDGYLKTEGKVINGTYPGPLIEACWGDEIVVHVKNKLKTNGTTIHWHGIRQFFSNYADGVNGITQCPIAEGESYTYKFRAYQYGHTWYHSHYSLQYPDGVAGPLLIHGPNSGDWDEALDPILINDWGHESAFAVFQKELEPLVAGLPNTQSILVDGKGTYVCGSKDDPTRCVGKGSIFTRTFRKGKRYLIRLINASADATFVFSIDNHLLRIISSDFVPIHPYTNESLLIGIGQRYSVIVEANPIAPIAKDGNYWIRTTLAINCGIIDQSNETTGIIRYNPASKALPTSTRHQFPTNCSDEPYESLKPIIPWSVGSHAANNVTENTYEANLSHEKFHQFARWDLTDTPLWLDFGNPTILNLENTTWNSEYAVVDYDYRDEWVYIVVAADLLSVNKTVITAAHPLHLHGHDFAILAQSSLPYNETEDPKHFNFDNPPRRDVALLPAGGYVALAFKSDNPGIWLLHCHIAWHASSGLALQIMERQKEISDVVGNEMMKIQDTCDSWDKWYNDHIDSFDQNDSGI